MEPVAVFKNKYHIEFRDVDFTKKLRLSSLFCYFQDIAAEHAENLGFGIDKLMGRYGVTWVLMRIKVDITRIPVWNEEIEIETWPQKPKKIEFERDFIVRDAGGNVLVRAVSTWAIIDTETRDLRKAEVIEVKYPAIKEERALDCRLGRLKAFGNLETAYRKVIGYSDIDMNGHLNNSKYIDFLMDCLTVENHEKFSLKTIEVNYVNEALPGDTITLYKDTSAVGSNLIYIEGVNEKEGKVVFKSQLELEA
jgi:acyl-ACP thioesterase